MLVALPLGMAKQVLGLNFVIYEKLQIINSYKRS